MTQYIKPNSLNWSAYNFQSSNLINFNRKSRIAKEEHLFEDYLEKGIKEENQQNIDWSLIPRWLVLTINRTINFNLFTSVMLLFITVL